MANRVLCAASCLLRSFGRLSVSATAPQAPGALNASLRPHLPAALSVRHTSFFNKLPADHLWKGVTSVSNAGKKRGRGKGAGKKMIKDLNKGQVIGQGRVNVLWPGLNAPVIRGRELVQQQKMPEDPEWETKLRQIRDSMANFRHNKMNALDRGWSGTKMPGRSIGAPDTIDEESFEGFDTRVLEMKTVIVMKGNLGRKRRQSVFVVTGNASGSAGFATAKSMDARAAMRKAKNRAAQKLMYVELCDGHTVFHDFFCQFGLTKIYVSKRPEGSGLVCHRAIKTICEVLGIRDLHAKVEGPTNVQHITKAFFLGLLQQKTHRQMAEEKGLHLVELRKETDHFPRIVASPTRCRTAEELRTDEVLDFTQYSLGDRIIYRKKKFEPFFTKHRSWEIRCRREEKTRNHEQVKLGMMIEHGELRSFLTDKYPECRPMKNAPPAPEVEEEEA